MGLLLIYIGLSEGGISPMELLLVDTRVSKRGIGPNGITPDLHWDEWGESGPWFSQVLYLCPLVRMYLGWALVGYNEIVHVRTQHREVGMGRCCLSDCTGLCPFSDGSLSAEKSEPGSVYSLLF